MATSAKPDAFYMRRALELAKRAWGDTAPNPMVGAVLVKNGEIIGEGTADYLRETCEVYREIEASQMREGGDG